MTGWQHSMRLRRCIVMFMAPLIEPAARTRKKDYMTHSRSRKLLQTIFLCLSALAAFLAAPQFAFGQDQPGGTAITPIAWALIAVLTVCGGILIILAARWRTVKNGLDRGGASDP